MVAETYGWAVDGQFPVEAKVAADTIRDLQRSLGKDAITAKELLDASRAEDAPLHSCFEWNDNVAAEHWRRYQALKLINSIKVTIIKDDKPPIETRVFLNIAASPKAEGQFSYYETVLNNPVQCGNVLEFALKELQAFQRKYSNLQELAGVFKAIDDLAGSLK